MDARTTLILHAQKEVHDHTHDSLVIPILVIFEDMYAKATDGKLSTFQKALREVPAWSQLKIESVCSTLQKSCNFLKELISALFLSHIKIMSSIKVAKISNVRVKVPKEEKFLHAVLIEAAKRFYENPKLFRSKMHQGAKENVIMEAIEATVRKLLPLKDILSAYLKSKTTEVAPLANDPDNVAEMDTPIHGPTPDDYPGDDSEDLEDMEDDLFSDSDSGSDPEDDPDVPSTEEPVEAKDDETKEIAIVTRPGDPPIIPAQHVQEAPVQDKPKLFFDDSDLEDDL
jgi:hypothetical protein